jgi:hypothetical protein
MRGYIGYFELVEWWISEFSEAEREHIESVFKPRGYESSRPLTETVITWTSDTAVSCLSTLSSWFSKKQDRSIAYRILIKAENLLDERTEVLDRHFLYAQLMSLNYKDRSLPENFKKSIEYCRKQIDLSDLAADAFSMQFENSKLPSHKGYKQLAIILEKQKLFREAIELCSKAKSQGWNGDWDRRIEKCEKRLNLQKNG